jgi:hypothetical protein
MSDRIDKFEAELAGMAPRALPEELARGIESSVASVRSAWSDRILAATMVAGAIAGCVIVAVLMDQSTVRTPQSQQSNASFAATPTLGDYQKSFALTDIAAADLSR